MEERAHEAFVKLYRETYDNILKYVVSKCSNAHDVPDIIQKTYLNYYERVKKYGNVDKPEGYLFKIANNEIKKYYRFKALHKSDVPVFSKTEDDVEYETLEALLTQEIPEYTDFDIQKVWQYIKERDALTFKIFVLYFYYDEKLSDIAKTLNIGESAVKNRLYRTINQMREKFKLL